MIFISEPAQSSGPMFFESMGSTDPSTSEGCREKSKAGFVPTLTFSPQHNEKDLLERKTKNHIVCCVLDLSVRKSSRCGSWE